MAFELPTGPDGADDHEMNHPASRGGPKTARGKSRSSINAARHGALTKLAVLPGEHLDHHVANFDDWMAQLKPASGAEVRAVVLIADLSMRLDRVRRVEAQMQIAALDEIVAKTSTFANAVAVKTATIVVDELILELVAMTSPPTPGPQLAMFARAARSVGNIVHDVGDLPLAEVAAFDAAIDTLDVGPADGIVVDWLAALLTTATAMGVLLRRRRRASGQQLARLKRSLVEGRLLVDDREAKRCARYRDQLQKAMLLQFEIFTAARDAAGQRRRRSRTGSFGKAPRAVPIRLRVVA